MPRRRPNGGSDPTSLGGWRFDGMQLANDWHKVLTTSKTSCGSCLLPILIITIEEDGARSWMWNLREVLRILGALPSPCTMEEEEIALWPCGIVEGSLGASTALLFWRTVVAISVGMFKPHNDSTKAYYWSNFPLVATGQSNNITKLAQKYWCMKRYAFVPKTLVPNQCLGHSQRQRQSDLYNAYR